MTPKEKEMVIRDKNVVANINGNMADILLDFVTTAQAALNDDCESHNAEFNFDFLLRYGVSREKSGHFVGYFINERTRCTICKTSENSHSRANSICKVYDKVY